jgi:hypothetical protein
VDGWIGCAGVQLRQAVRVATAFFDPACIVIGGRLPGSLNARLVEIALASPIDGPSRGLPIAPVRASLFGSQVGAMGAACVPLFKTFFPGPSLTLGVPILMAVDRCRCRCHLHKVHNGFCTGTSIHLS